MARSTGKRRKAGVYMNYKAGRWAAAVCGLGAVGRSVLLAIAHASDDHGCSWPSLGVIAAHAQCTERTVSRYLRTFAGRDLVHVQQRFNPQRSRISNLYVLTGWPDRTLIPAGGHPVLGPRVRETAQTLARYHALRQGCLMGGDNLSGQLNKTPESYLLTTDPAFLAARQRCFEALGPWAHEANRQLLGEDAAGLLRLLEEFDLDTCILPILAQKSCHGLAAPPLRTWRYFLEPMRYRAERLTSGEEGAQDGKEVSRRRYDDSDARPPRRRGDS